MAATYTTSNHYKFQLASGNIDFDADVFKVILMNTTFTFNKDTHATLADVTADQLATGNGYTQNDKTLAGVSVTEDDTNDKAAITWNDVTWTATADNIGPTGAYIVYDDTTADDTVVFCVDFGTDYTIPNTFSIQIQDIAVSLT